MGPLGSFDQLNCDRYVQGRKMHARFQLREHFWRDPLVGYEAGSSVHYAMPDGRRLRGRELLEPLRSMVEGIAF